MPNPLLPALAFLSLTLSAPAEPGRVRDVIYTGKPAEKPFTSGKASLPSTPVKK